MKKLLLAAIAVIALAPVATTGENVTLRFSWWGGSERHEGTLKVIKMFEEANPGVTIKAEYMGWQGYLERLATQIGSNSEPDIMQINWAWIDMFSRKGDGLYDLGKVKDSLNLAEYSESMLNSGVSNGVLNALPVSMTTRFFFWNKTTWDKAGAALPTTWDELLAAGPKFKALGDQYYPMDLEPIEGLYILDAWLYEKYGKQIIHSTEPRFEVDEQELLDGISFYKKLFDTHTAVSAKIRTASSGQYDKPSEQVSEYVTGLWAGTFIWSSMLDLRISGPIGTGHEMVMGKMLTQDGTNPKPDRIGRPAMMLTLGKNTKHPELAAKFISFFLTDPEATKALGLARGIPAAKSAYQALMQENKISAASLEAQAQLESVKIVYTNPVFEHERMRQFLLDVLESVSHEKETPEEAAGRMIRDGTKLIRRILR